MSLSIQLDEVHLRYGQTPALQGVTAEIPAGSICGLLGRNGSGKTTLMSLIASYRRPTSGAILVGGEDPFENRAIAGQVALVGGEGGGDTYNVKDVLAMADVLRPSWDAELAGQLVERFEIPQKTKVSELSRGKRAALGATCGLASRAALTMFDEAHLGMDAPSRAAFYDTLLIDYMDHPRTIIMSTHHIDEVASLFSEVLILDAGRVLAHAETDELRQRGHELTGPADAVDEVTRGMQVMGERRLGPTKAAVVLGDLSADQRERARALGVELGLIPLQDLVIHMTGPVGTTQEDAS